MFIDWKIWKWSTCSWEGKDFFHKCNELIPIRTLQGGASRFAEQGGLSQSEYWIYDGGRWCICRCRDEKRHRTWIKGERIAPLTQSIWDSLQGKPKLPKVTLSQCISWDPKIMW